ncbi:class I SAM-dependent methyltransferase [Desertifilum sp. FACHB-1129]|uniref:SAM-dependent methyltransferase n=1 Tax=Desertifilum tharense IPPAS B-1220 TaxID=1781255 RepID=A0A1E5QLM1_9CYAN|nr:MULTISPECIES: class I SAM-dependent methyltransferase [Desertifilum]MDA0209310.1 class I SAM-dependent methyltransferase [Cyanobacteria bacterium FC1]MBD2314923.1 class I SAM-dependent methyltransferase [Desertifilum sp. FACHB-1129]MBD2325144.1 class I SAM-dependent methyltransferase [Desertifilum sp. FACHB-866]MBD2332714.1 class I SAM-dependent methyltransferase [Desertifilum sp. FACHB-868]OEJ75477.1 SAM-dependent methyltransferase [Desertifilum tharense IPPAS B-1220]
MATILRELSYRYQWLYDGVSQLAALSVGGERRFRQLALKNLDLQPQTQILDLCCGSGQTTQFLVEYSQQVTGLDASPLSLKRAQRNVPQASYVESFAESMPFEDNQFDVVHTSVAMHEMTPHQLQQILPEVYRVLRPGGTFALIDLHSPTNPLFWPGLALFLALFETETAWQLIETDLSQTLQQIGFHVTHESLHAGGSLQVIQAQKPL